MKIEAEMDWTKLRVTRGWSDRYTDRDDLAHLTKKLAGGQLYRIQEMHRKTIETKVDQRRPHQTRHSPGRCSDRDDLAH